MNCNIIQQNSCVIFGTIERIYLWIHIVFNFNSITHYVYHLMSELYYRMDDIESANHFLIRAVAFCISIENYNYIEKEIKPKADTLYPLLTLPVFR